MTIVADFAYELHPMNMGFPMTRLPRILFQSLVIPFGSAGYVAPFEKGSGTAIMPHEPARVIADG